MMQRSKIMSLGVIAAAIAISVPPSQSQVGVATMVAPQTTVQQPRQPRQRPAIPPILRSRGNFGDPLAGLSSDQLDAFKDGLEEFASVDTAETGLGPIFNNNSCAACHSVPATGGSSTIFVTRFGRMVNGNFDPLDALGGSLLQSAAIDPLVQEVIPPEANITARRVTTPLFGVGLVEAIPDSVITQNALRSKPDGVTGKLSTVLDPASGQTRVGRFGWKAQHANLLSFAADAYINEMGITNRIFPHENAPNGNVALMTTYDTVADPEDQTDPVSGKADIDHFADFMRMLAPPPRGTMTANVAAGALLFADAGCAVCHLPLLLTGTNAISALDHKPVALFSDLLLHDMGALGDGIAQGSAGPQDMRTPPLWGLSARTTYLHDGRATTVDTAIRLHDGEAANARDRYKAFPAKLQAQLQAFLGSI